MTNSSMSIAELEELFADEPVYEIPSVADRYRYKKVGGSSDTAQTQDVFD